MDSPWPPVEVTAVTDTFLSLMDEAVPGLVEGLYLHGSLGFGEWYPERSDIDYVAVLARPAPIDLLRDVHGHMADTFARPPFDGFHCTWDELARGPDGLEPPCTLGGIFFAEERHDVHPVTWHELASHGVRMRGPELAQVKLWTDERALRQYTHDNLAEYWAGEVEVLRKFPDQAGRPEIVTWFVLGTARLHHLLATNALTSKTGAGFYAERVFDPRWHELVGEALSYRALGVVTADYDPDRMAEQVVEFADFVVRDGLAIRV
jgi:hypothetical protein